MNNPILTPAETRTFKRWSDATPRFPGNTVPGWSHLREVMPDEIIDDTYEQLIGEKPPKGSTRSRTVQVIDTLNDIIAQAEARGQ